MLCDRMERNMVLHGESQVWNILCYMVAIRVLMQVGRFEQHRPVAKHRHCADRSKRRNVEAN